MKRRALLLSPLALAACATPAAAPAGVQGWAAVEGGTHGGSDAKPEHRLDIRTRAELDAALALRDTPKLLRIHGRIDLAAGQGEAAFRDPAFDLDAYTAAYTPAAWGRRAPAGPLEDARKRSAARQAAAVTLRLPPRTTLIGATPDAGFTNGMLLLDGVHDIVIRHLRFHPVLDHFPGWDPEDGAHGAWNSDYDTVSLRRSHHVWVDHCSFGAAGIAKPLLLGRPFERTDGLLDITRMSDLVTVSWCHFAHHDKTMLIGSSDNQTEDAGRLRVTLHHNLWERCNERTPRVRFGQVHLANNLFLAPDASRYGYSIGLGHRAQIVSDANVWDTDPAITGARLLRPLKGTQFADRDSLHNGQPIAWPAFEAPTFTPPPVAGLLPAREVAAAVRAGAGTGHSRVVHNLF
jgi:pectate lyase